MEKGWTLMEKTTLFLCVVRQLSLIVLMVLIVFISCFSRESSKEKKKKRRKKRKGALSKSIYSELPKHIMSSQNEKIVLNT